MKENFEIYILCPDEDGGRRKEALFAGLGLPAPRVRTGTDYYAFINSVIADCPAGYALICHDDVVVPANIREQVACSIGNADEEFGADNWAFMGNAGIDSLNYRALRFVKDPGDGPLPWTNIRPYPAVHLDGNLLLANVGNCKKRGFAMPSELAGTYGYDLVLVMESYMKGLVCAIDSALFAIHEGTGDAEVYASGRIEPGLLDYLKKRFINHSFITLRGLISIDNTIDYLIRIGTDPRKCFYTHWVQPTLAGLYSGKKRKKVHLVTMMDGRREETIRRFLDSVRIAAAVAAGAVDIAVHLILNREDRGVRDKLSLMAAEYQGLSIGITDAIQQCGKDAELVSAFATMLKNNIDGDECYYWFVRSEDFVMPSIFPYFPQILHESMVAAGDVQFFDERWDDSGRSVPSLVRRRERLESRTYCTGLVGKQNMPASGLIYPVRLIKDYLYDENGAISQYDDVFLMKIAFRAAVDTVPLVAAGMCGNLDQGRTDDVKAIQESFRQATAVSRFIKAGIMRKIEYDYLNYLHDDMEKARQSIPYQFMEAIMAKKWLYSSFEKMKPLAMPVLRFLFKINDRW
ncbi:MAG: hypothetical protein KA369_00720 [Spirochaetes bacterium]|nr:hypothetical protein [Spirochaetota bacterium]